MGNKNFLLWLCAIVFSITAVACSSDDGDPQNNVSVDQTRVAAGYWAGTYEISLSAKAAWRAELQGAHDWCVLTQAEGEAGDGTLIFDVSENVDKSPRSAVINVICGGTTVPVTVSQIASGGEKTTFDRSLDGRYYGFYDTGKAYLNFTLLSGAFDGQGNATGTGYELTIGCFVSLPDDPQNATLDTGVYNVGDSDTGAPRTFITTRDMGDYPGTLLRTFDAVGTESVLAIGSGSLQVTLPADGGYLIEGYFDDGEGNLFAWKYEGELEFENALNLVKDPYGNTILRGEEKIISAKYFYVVGSETGNLILNILGETNYIGAEISLFFDRDGASGDGITIAEGEYMPGSDGSSMTFETGRITQDDEPAGTYYYDTFDRQPKCRKTIDQGVVTVKKNGDGYNILFDLSGTDVTSGERSDAWKYRYIGPLTLDVTEISVFKIDPVAEVTAGFSTPTAREDVTQYDLVFFSGEDWVAGTDKLQLQFYGEAQNPGSLPTGTFTCSDTMDPGTFYKTDFTAGYYPKGTVFVSYYDEGSGTQHRNYNIDSGSFSIENVSGSNYTFTFDLEAQEGEILHPVRFEWTGTVSFQ